MELVIPREGGGEQRGSHHRHFSFANKLPICHDWVLPAHCFSLQDFASLVAVLLSMLPSRASQPFRELWKGAVGGLSDHPGVAL